MDIGLLLEAEKRGLLPPDKLALLNEARKRGLVPGGAPAQAAPPPNDVPPGGDMSQWQQTPPGLGPSQPSAPQPGMEPQSLADLNDMLGGAAATAKGAIKGATALPGMVADVPFQIANMMGAEQQLPSQAQSAMLEQLLGDTSRYKTVENFANAGTGAVVPAAMADRAAQGASAAVAPYLESFAAQPGTQMVAGVTGEGARQAAEAGGAGAVGQTVAALAGGLGGVMVPQALGDAARGAGRVIYHAGIEPHFEAGRTAIKGRALLDATGDRSAAVAQALRDYEPKVPGSVAPAGEAAADAGSAEFSAMQNSAEGVLPSEYVARGKERDAARLAQVRTVGQDDEALKLAEALRNKNAEANYGAIRNDMVAPQADDALMEGEIANATRQKGEALQDAGRFGTMAAQQQSLSRGGMVEPPATDVGSVSNSAYPREGMPVPDRALRSDDMPGSAFPVRGQPRIPPRYTENAQRVPEAREAIEDAMSVYETRKIEENWLRDMQAKLLEQSDGASKTGLEDFIGRPSIQDALSDARKTAAESGIPFPRDPSEPFSVQNLQDIKESLDRGISATKQAETAGRRPEIGSGKLASTRDAFIKWLESKSPEWSAARTQYKTDSAPINQMKIGQHLEEKLTGALDEEAPQRAASYATALRQGHEVVPKRVTGGRITSIDEALTPEQLAAVESVRDDLASMAEQQRLARAGSRSGKNVMQTFTNSIDATGHSGQLPNLLSRPAMAFNFIMRRLKGQMDEKLAREIAQEMLDPKATGLALEAAMAREPTKRLAAGLRYRQSANAAMRGSMAGNTGTNGE